MARPKGRENIRPTRKAIQSYYQMLRSAADTGDIHAAGWLLNLEQQRQGASRPPNRDSAV